MLITIKQDFLAFISSSTSFFIYFYLFFVVTKGARRRVYLLSSLEDIPLSAADATLMQHCCKRTNASSSFFFPPHRCSSCVLMHLMCSWRHDFSMTWPPNFRSTHSSFDTAPETLIIPCGLHLWPYTGTLVKTEKDSEQIEILAMFNHKLVQCDMYCENAHDWTWEIVMFFRKITF